ncbi:MAG: HAMP domain-containing histidine kinase [Clostridia bacterium]|nr:HAMP domain-containing histidine kinase [Clostridia bacterium]
MDEKKPVNPEEVEYTLKEIRAEQDAKNNQKGFWKKAWSVICWPFRQIKRFVKFVASKIPVPITAKTTIIFTLLFTVALIILDAFIVSSVSNHLQMLGVDDEGYIISLTLTSALLIIISVIVVAALGALASTAMLSPVRKIIKQIDSISADDLSARIDNVDAQDELRELTERINAMLDNLEESFDRQKKFVSDASHELKTPIAVIQGYSNMLLRWGKEDKEVLDESVESIAREADNMKVIVEQLLTLARMGQYMVKSERFDVSQILDELSDSYALVCKTHTVKVSAKKALVNADKNMLTECLRTLVDNAIKYSDEGKTVKISCYDEDGYVKIEVSDEGCGISEDDLPRVFDRFYRCDKARKRNGKGSGLGLTIAKSIVEKMNGTIEVVSEVGVGSTFTVRLPLAE